MAEYIEREALLLHIKGLPTWWADAGGVYGRSMKYPEGMFDCEDVVNSIENAPSVEVAPVVHGRWVEKEKYTFGIMYDCSLCENRILDNGHTWNYCPNCGADMRGINDE